MDLKDFIKELDYIDQYVYNGVFYNRDYAKDNHKFQLCCKVAENLTVINSIKMIKSIELLKILPADYVDIILDIATKLKPSNKDYYNAIKQSLIGIYVTRLNELVEKDEVDLLTCEKQKHRKINTQ